MRNRRSPGDLDKALPGVWVDKLTQGIPSHDLRRVWSVFVSIAMSAQRREWGEQEFVNAVAADENRLWHQLNCSRNGGQRSPRLAYGDLRRAWLKAGSNLAGTELRTLEDLAADAEELAFEWAEALEHPNIGLSARDLAVMNHVVEQVRKRRMVRVTCPRREVALLVNISEKAARLALAHLTNRGFLVKVSPGRGGDPAEGRPLKAAIYGLPRDVWGP